MANNKKTDKKPAKQQVQEAEKETKAPHATETPKEEVEKVDNSPEQREIPAAEQEQVQEAEKEQVIPAYALEVLALYPKMEWLYVGKGGRTYRNGTPESVRGNAVLYKNPYFKNN